MIHTLFIIALVWIILMCGAIALVIGLCHASARADQHAREAYREHRRRAA